MSEIDKVIVHPLVLLSVVDHYNRVAKGTKKRVVGILLGEYFKGQVDVTNSYAVPFEEDAKDSTIWFLDHNYHEEMHAMFKKVNAKEKVLGWYSTGPKIRGSDLQINELVRRYTAEPVMCIIDVNPKDNLETPTKAYISVENAPEQQSVAKRTFRHIPSEIGAYEAEEVGVEHLLRNISENTMSSVGDQVQAKLASLHSLKKRMEQINKYLDNVIAGKVPPNHQIMYNIQDILNLCPDLLDETLIKSMSVANNDNSMVVYLASIVRSILALHNLINNKIGNKKLLEKQDEKEEKKVEKKDEKDDKKKKGDEKEEKKVKK